MFLKKAVAHALAMKVGILKRWMGCEEATKIVHDDKEVVNMNGTYLGEGHS